MSEYGFNPILDEHEQLEPEAPQLKYCKGCQITRRVNNFYVRNERKGKYQYIRLSDLCKKCTSEQAYANKLKRKSKCNLYGF